MGALIDFGLAALIVWGGSALFRWRWGRLSLRAAALSAGIVFGISLWLLQEAQVWALHSQMREMFGPRFPTDSLRVGPPVFSSLGTAAVWHWNVRPAPKARGGDASRDQATLEAELAPSASEPSADEGPAKANQVISSAIAHQPARVTRDLLIAFGLATVLAVCIYLSLPRAGQSQEACLAQRTRGAVSNAQVTAAQVACEHHKTSLELSCGGTLSASELNQLTGGLAIANGAGSIEVLVSDGKARTNRVALLLEFTDGTTRNYTAELYEVAEKGVVARGYFRVLSEDANRELKTWWFESGTSCRT